MKVWFEDDEVELPISIDDLLPAIPHSRTSCSDDDWANSDAHYPSGAPRCYRCGLLEANKRWGNGYHAYDEDEYRIHMEIKITWR